MRLRQALWLVGVFALTVAGVATASPGSPLRLLIIGIDGAEWEVLGPLLQSQRLPHLQRLIDQGAFGETLATKPMFSPILWTTIATGKGVEKHGITGFTQVDSQSGRMLPITSDRRRCKAFWNILGEHGLRVGVLGWLATWPAEPVNGIIVSNYAYPPVFEMDRHPLADQTQRTISPPEARARFEAYVVPPDLVSATELRRQKLAGLLDVRTERYAYAKDTAHFHMAIDLLENDSIDVLAIYFQGIDLLSHWTWPAYKWERWVRYNEPTLIALQSEAPAFSLLPAPARRKTGPNWTPEFRVFVRRQGALLESYWAYLDFLLGKLLRAGTDEDTYVLLLSDHGFYTNEGQDMLQTAETQYTRPTHWHRDRGVFVLSGPGVSPGQRGSLCPEDILPTLLYALDLPVAQDMDGQPRLAFFEFEVDRSPRFIPTYDDKRQAQPTQPASQSPLDEAILDQLRSLGYIQ